MNSALMTFKEIIMGRYKAVPLLVRVRLVRHSISMATGMLKFLTHLPSAFPDLSHLKPGSIPIQTLTKTPSSKNMTHPDVMVISSDSMIPESLRHLFATLRRVQRTPLAPQQSARASGTTSQLSMMARPSAFTWMGFWMEAWPPASRLQTEPQA